MIVCTGPLTEGALGEVIRAELGGDRMYFYDAIAPIVAADSIDWDFAFRASRWGRDSDAPDRHTEHDRAAGGDTGVGDYVNCPLNKAEYEAFVEAVNAGRKVLPHDFEEPKYFESCMPIEVMAERGPQTLRFGPMRPIGLRDPRTGHRPWAVVQLRPENKYLTAYNLVGFQTRLAYPEQQRIFQMIPGLGKAEFLRFGSIHRNTYIDAPARLGMGFELRTRPNVRFAGLLTGVEGYIESCAMGLVVAWLLGGRAHGARRTRAAADDDARRALPARHRAARRRLQVRPDQRELRPVAAATRRAQGQPQAADGRARARGPRDLARRGAC